MPPRPREAKALILAPTRELALQIDDKLPNLWPLSQLRRAVILGGVSQQPRSMPSSTAWTFWWRHRAGCSISCSQGHVRLDAVEIFVVDEADRMLDMGFIRDVRKIVALCPGSANPCCSRPPCRTDIARLVGEC